MKVLIVSTSLGAGHNGMASELSRQLIQQSHDVHTVDFLSLLPGRTGALFAACYRAQLRYVPWSYERSYSKFGQMRKGFALVMGRASRKRLLSAIESSNPDIVVPNNPHAAMALGYLKQQKILRLPVVTYVTDFGVHPLWVHPSIDAHLLIHDEARREAEMKGAPQPIVINALVSEEFRSKGGASALRETLGISEDSIAVLITAGSWGVGEVKKTVDDVLRVPNALPIAVCGRDSRLQDEMSKRPGCLTLGWVDNMADLMRAADVLVENAGGMTSLEAFAADLPVITYRPIAGHGRHNARSMRAAGVAVLAEDSKQLCEAILRIKADAPTSARFADNNDVIAVLESYVPQASGKPVKLRANPS